ncbi:copper chaperone PCu(A)C [Vibrio sp. FNV 38]|nr:copper chaperone PCu(A)C [Vibrio sp. FNV 38]
MRSITTAIALLALSISSVFAQNDLTVHNAYARATPPGVTTSAVFATLSNSSDEPVVIVSAQTARAGKVELHTVETEGDIMKMRQVKNFSIPSKETLHLKPGADHIMLFNLDKPLVEGQIVNVEITLRNGPIVVFPAPVKKVMQGMKHHH